VLAAVRAGFGAVGSCGLAFGGAALGVKFGLQRVRATVGLRGPLGQLGELAANSVQLRANTLEFAAKLIGRGLCSLCTLVLGLHALP
jgi:hypothetical protein